MPVVNVAPRLSSRPLSHRLPYNNSYYRLPSSPVPRRTRLTHLHHCPVELSRLLLCATCCYTPNYSSSPDQFPRRRLFDDDFFTNFHSSSAASDLFHNHAPFTSLPASSTSTTTTTRFHHSKVDLLEPSLLGIRTDPPDWPERDEMIRFRIARRASCVELPLSLRMIKKKKNLPAAEVWEKEPSAAGGGGGVEISTAFCSTVSVIRELQTHALRLRGLAMNEDVENRVDSEMKSSFVWLFREVFSKTPDLMLDVMRLTVDFASTSMENNLTSACQEGVARFASGKTTASEKKEVRTTTTTTTTMNSSSKTSSSSSSTSTEAVVVEGTGEVTDELGAVAAKGSQAADQTRRYPGESMTESANSIPVQKVSGREEIMDEEETELWNSMLEEASKIQIKEKIPAAIVDFTTLQKQSTQSLISPVRVEIERDDYVDFDRTNLLYQIRVTKEPNNALLLSNYAQFLYLVARDHDRAEECFQRAIEVDSSDPEVMSQYATFLWIVRKDMWGAEERYQQAMAVEPDNPYYASKYANFLWNTGGEDTCYPAAS